MHGQAYIMQDALLYAPSIGLGQTTNDLLPQNTQIFSSTVRYGRIFYGCAAAILIISLGLLLAAVADSSMRTPLLGAAFGLGGVGAFALWLMTKRAKYQYNNQMRMGEWHEGVIVFPSGDIVIRFSGLWRSVDKTIEASYLSRADVERRCSPSSCSRRNHLRLYYLNIDAKPAVLTISEAELRDSVSTVAEYINELKGKANIAPLF